MVSDVIFQLVPGSEVLVYHGARLLHNDEMLSTAGLDAGGCLEIYECLGGGGNGCSRTRREDDVLALGNAEISSNAQNLNITAVNTGISLPQAEEKKVSAPIDSATSGAEGAKLLSSTEIVL